MGIPIQRSSASLLTFAVFMLAAIASAAAANDAAHSLDQHYQNKVMLLREYHSGNRLTYDSQGRLIEGGALGTWTFDGHIEINEIKLKGDELEIEGTRVCVAFNRREHNRHALRFGKVRVDIVKLQDPLIPDALEDSFFKVFHRRGEETSEILPSYWRPIFAAPSEVPSANSDFGTLDGQRIFMLETGMTSPAPGEKFKLSFSKTATHKHSLAPVDMYLLVDGSGTVRDVLHVGETVGNGVDQLAITTVRAWRLKPALKDCAPLAVMAMASITFEHSGTFAWIHPPIFKVTQPSLVPSIPRPCGQH